MADNDAKNQKDTRRFRLPKLFADTEEDEVDDAEASARKAETVAARAQVLGVSLPEPVPSDVIARANQTFEGPRATVLSANEVQGVGVAAPAVTAASSVAQAAVSVTPDEIEDLSDRIDDLHTLLAEINDRGLAQDKVFNTLHNELQDYKNDFIYEHLKPVVRPLLFLFDSMEQFEDEMDAVERKIPANVIINGAPPAIVRENIQFFREQLVESLRICEVTPMQTPEGRYDPRLHKPVETVSVTAEHDGEIQRVVRSGWFLNGRVFRPAEVVVGKATEAKAAGKADAAQAG